MILRTALTPLSVREIQVRLSALRVEAHPDYVAHLASYNGAVADDYQVRFGGEGTAGFLFVGFDYDLADLEHWAEILSDTALPGVVPLALDAMGNAFVVGSSGRVRFWDHDTHRSVAAFDTIADFIGALERTPGTEPTGPDVEGMPLAELVALANSEVVYLFRAARLGRLDMVDFVMEAHPEHAARFLLLAAVGGQLAVVEALFQRGVAVDARSSGGQTPLMGAAASGHRQVVHYLLDQGANPTLESDNGMRASAMAVGKIVILLYDAEDAWTGSP